MREHIVKRLGEHPYVALGMAALFLSLGAGSVTGQPLVGVPLIAIAGVLGFLGARLRESKSEQSSTLRTRLDRSEEQLAKTRVLLVGLHESVTALAESWLKAIAEWAELDSDSRISLYRLENHGWRREARWSQNLLFMQSGRIVLPHGQGIVHQAHLIGDYSVDNLADFESDPEAYLSEQKKMNVNRGACRDFKMKSRSYVCFAFGRETDRGRRPYVIVFESVDPNGLDSEGLRSLLHSDARRALIELTDIHQLVRQELLYDEDAEKPSAGLEPVMTGV